MAQTPGQPALSNRELCSKLVFQHQIFKLAYVDVDKQGPLHEIHFIATSKQEAMDWAKEYCDYMGYRRVYVSRFLFDINYRPVDREEEEPFPQEVKVA